ncbi:CHAP domain-containing protein [Ruminococcus sp.]|uniref:CHAP domain-containing protein n=1 Tax=Ruminococcus sp. TaxID=41978 RepID=UPI0025E8F975|nr:CHAP domain-containing protein [Ruminococcus sp.]MBQ8966210.1 CHAP domain-containing protein [Ruminococcus sp.]
MTFDEYFAARVGKKIDYDGNYGVQCFDLANDYAVKVVGGKQFIGMGAYEIYTNFANQPAHELYERIPNTPDFVPKKGDIMVWGTTLGKWGHVAVCNGKGDTTWFESYDQNWTGRNEGVTLVRHNYKSVLGVLRPKNQERVLGKPADVKGDLNGDGKVDVTDLNMLTAHVKGIKALK